MRMEALLSRLGYDSTWDYMERQAWLLDPENFALARPLILNTANIGPKRWFAFLNYMGLTEKTVPIRLGL